MEADVVTLDQLQRALARCMEAHPPEGLERSLHRYANRLAGLWGLMTYERTPAIAVNQIEPVVLEVYRRWMDSAAVKS